MCVCVEGKRTPTCSPPQAKEPRTCGVRNSDYPSPPSTTHSGDRGCCVTTRSEIVGLCYLARFTQSVECQCGRGTRGRGIELRELPATHPPPTRVARSVGGRLVFGRQNQATAPRPLSQLPWLLRLLSTIPPLRRPAANRSSRGRLSILAYPPCPSRAGERETSRNKTGEVLPSGAAASSVCRLRAFLLATSASPLRLPSSSPPHLHSWLSYRSKTQMEHAAAANA